MRYSYTEPPAITSRHATASRHPFPRAATLHAAECNYSYTPPHGSGLSPPCNYLHTPSCCCTLAGKPTPKILGVSIFSHHSYKQSRIMLEALEAPLAASRAAAVNIRLISCIGRQAKIGFCLQTRNSFNLLCLQAKIIHHSLSARHIIQLPQTV